MHTVFETTKRQEGAPDVKQKAQHACLPPLKAAARGQLVAPDAKIPAGYPSLACYKHYDVQLDWSENDVDTSVWAGDVQAYTRMFYARYGMGPPGATPWRLGRGLQPHQKLQAQAGGKDTDTFMTRAHVEIQEKLQHTSLDLWQQFSSSPIDTVDLDTIKMWAEAMRPRSIHDLKPMLMLCQSLLRDLASVHKGHLVQVQEDLQKSTQQQLEQVRLEQEAREKALQRRVETLNTLVAASTDSKTTDANSAAAVADMKSEHDRRVAAMLAQLEEKEADLAVLAQDLIARGGVPRGANGCPLPISSLASSVSPAHLHGGTSSTASGVLEAERPTTKLSSTKPTTPISSDFARLAAQAQPCGMTADGKPILQLGNGVRVMLVGYNEDGSPIYADASDPTRIIIGVDESGQPICAPSPVSEPGAWDERQQSSGHPGNLSEVSKTSFSMPGLDPSRPSVLSDPGTSTRVKATGQRNDAGQEVFALADGTRVVITGRTANGEPIYALADDPLQIFSGLDASGAPMFVQKSLSTTCLRQEARAALSSPVHGMRSTSREGCEVQGSRGNTPVGALDTSGSCTGALQAGAAPAPQVVVAEDGTKRYIFSSDPGMEPLEVGPEAVIATRDDGSPIFAANTVMGFTADGAAIVADGRGGTFKDSTLGNARVNSAAAKAVVKEREARIRSARQMGVLPQAGLFTATRGAREDHSEKAGEYLAAAVLQSAVPTDSAQTASRSAITAVQSNTDEPSVFTVGELAVNCEGEVIGYLEKNGETVVDFDGATICTMDRVLHTDGRVVRQSGATVSEEFVDLAAASIVLAAVLRSCVADDSVVGYMSSQNRVVDDSGVAVGTFDGVSTVRCGEGKTMEVQNGNLVSLNDISDAAFRGAAQAEQESAHICLPPDFSYAIGPSGNVLGQVLTDGRVLDSNGNCKGMMQPDGTVKTKEGLLLGAAARGMAIVDEDGKFVAVLNEQGFVKKVNGGPLSNDIDMDETGLLTTADGNVVGVTVGAAPRAYAAIRNEAGDVVGYEDARGVVCSTEGVPVSRCAGSDGMRDMPGVEPGFSVHHTTDMNTSVVLDAQNNVVGVKQLAPTAEASQSEDAVSSSDAVDVSNTSYRQSHGLLYASDGSLAGSAVSVIVAGLAVVSTAGQVIGDISAEGEVTSSTGADIGTVDEHNVLWSPSGSMLGAVSALHAVRSSTGSIAGAVSLSTGMVVDESLAPVPTAACCGTEVWKEETALVGVIQGLPPPLLWLKMPPETEGQDNDSDAQDMQEGEAAPQASPPKRLSVAWSDLRVTARNGEAVGWWCCRRSCIVNEEGEELMSPDVEETSEPHDSLPQALDNDGGFLGYVLSSKAVVDASGHQVGAVMRDGTVFDSCLAAIGTFNLANIRPNCNVSGVNGRPLGYLQQDGRVVSQQNGAVAGFLTPSGAVLNDAGQFVGVARIATMDGLIKDADGIVRDADGRAVGHVSTDGTLFMGDPFVVREVRCLLPAALNEVTQTEWSLKQNYKKQRPDMIHEAIQCMLDGMSLAQLSAEIPEEPASSSPHLSRPSTSSSSASSRVKKLRAATKIIGLTNVSKRNAIKEQLERLAELRNQILVKMQSRQVKDSLLELRKYRRPPRAAAQVITALMVICSEPLCIEWRHQALQGLQFPDHPNHVAQIWVALTPLLQPNLSEQLAGIDGNDLSQDMSDRLKAARQIMQGMTEKEAQRASYVVRLLHEFIDLLHEFNLRAHEFAQLEE